MSESSVNRQEAAADPGLVVVRREGGLANKIIVGAHHLAADEGGAGE